MCSTSTRGRKLASWRDADGNTMSFTYNAQSNLQTVADGFGRTLTLTYDGTGSNLVSVSDNTGRSVSYSVANGNLTSVTDADGFSWQFGYDSNHRALWLRDPLSQITVSNLFSSVSGKVLSQRNAAGTLWNMYVVPQHRSAEENPLGDKTVYLFDDKTRQIGLVDALGNERYAVYDGQNHIIGEQDARGNFTLHEYDGNQNRTNTLDAQGNQTAFSYDAQNRLVKVRDTLGHETATEYDAEHHPIRRIDALSNRTVVAYYPNGLPQTITGPRGEVTSYTYDCIRESRRHYSNRRRNRNQDLEHTRRFAGPDRSQE